MYLSNIIKEAEQYLSGQKVVPQKVIESYGGNNHLCFGENTEYMKWALRDGYKGKVDLIYIDPPFFSGSDYKSVISLPTDDKIQIKSYEDVWNNNINEYLVNLAARILCMKELLSSSGTIWLHLDYHVVHYAKIIMDEIFGMNNFVNEIIWHYKSGGSGKRHFSRKHDNILVYSKTKDYYFDVPKEKSYNRNFKPYRFKNVNEYEDDLGWYTLVKMKDVWSLDMVGRTSAERTGYATQKPLSLMKRIIESASPKGGLCADFFAGSGSFLVGASQLERKWIGCEAGKSARVYLLKRLLKENISFDIQSHDDFQDMTDFDIPELSNNDKEKIQRALHDGEKVHEAVISYDFDYDGRLHKDRLHCFFRDESEEVSLKSNTSIVKYDILGNRRHIIRYKEEMPGEELVIDNEKIKD